jgi:5-methyltetrahydrofolate--homocysteine methyltransferase
VTSEAYRRLESVWRRGGVVVLDGGVGSELQRVGFPRDRNVDELWGTVALVEAPELAKEVHRRYVHAGADAITTHTWRIDGLRAEERGATARRAVELAREAAAELGRPETAVAFSVWPEPLDRALAADLAEVSYRWTVNGPPDLRSQGIPRYAGGLPEADGDLLVRAAAGLEELGVDAVLLNCMPRELIPGMLPLLRESTSLPLGVYPNLGTYRNPGWWFDDDVTPEAYARDAARWRDIEGAQIIGGCCGTTPEHIAAVVELLRSR